MTTEAKPAELSGHKTPDLDFDADARALEREQAKITIGSRVFHRRRKNWDVSRQQRTMLREQDHESSKGERLQRELEDLDGTRIDRLQHEYDAIPEDERGSEAAKRTLAKLNALSLVRDAIDPDELDEKIADLHARLDAAADAADDAAFRLIALLIRDENGEPPDVAFLKEHLDTSDAGSLVVKLAVGGEPDPTPPAATTATS